MARAVKHGKAGRSTSRTRRKGAAPALSDKTLVHELFEATAARLPDAPALIHGDSQLSYGELERRASQLAHVLRARGAGGDLPVGLCLERSLDLACAVLAALKAGAAYVPFDPSYPTERLEWMLTSSGVKVVVAHDHLVPRLPARSGVDVLNIDEARERLAEAPASRLPARAHANADDLAYVLFTSGSTGRPKGVAMPHRPLVNLIRWQAARSAAGPGSRTLQFAPISFDVSFQELFASWAVGATLVLIDDEQRLDAVRLLAFIEAQRIDRLFLPFVALQHLAEVADGPGRKPSTLREVITAGEQLKVTRHLVSLFKALPACTLDNQYGPTECHVVTAHKLEGPPESWPELPPIGQPIANTAIYLLDERGQPAGAGEEGELYIGGVPLARGYMNQPEQTAERFLPDPFATVEGARMYRTGDLARRRDDGEIDYLGRIDGQVKVRGYRIELGEIEVALSSHEGVAQSAVIAREDTPGDKRLVAYLVAAGPAPRPSDLRRHLERRLPDYMLPSAYVLLEVLPRTPSGKVDRRALPPPPRTRPDLDEPYVEPRGELETRLAHAFQRALGIEQVGANDSFFELGGNSLLGLQVVAQLHGEGLDLPIVLLYEQATVRALAQRLGGGGGRSAYQTARDRVARARGAGEVASGDERAIAIIGMAGRFPGARDVETLWQNLVDGREGISFFAADEIHPSVDRQLQSDPRYVRARGIIEQADCFDARFFGVNPRLAEVTDPQQRVLLELAWQALELAGCDPRRFDGAIGVYAGVGNNTYYPTHVLPNAPAVARVGSFQVMVQNEKDYVATRIAHALDLSGPAVSIHTACSTSLVAICEAVSALRSGQCDLALAGAVSITVPLKSGYLYQEGAMLSPDGHCRPFDAAAAGTTFSDGGGVVVLRRLSDALAARDPIVAVIKGVALNNDGAQKASFTAPSVEGQAQVIALAQADAGVEPDSVSYIEAHGTATPLGDPIEIEGLTRAFRGQTDARQFCALGSIKSNIGHLTAAAGVAGLIKTALALQARLIPPSLHFAEPNPNIPFSDSPFFVNRELRPWSDVPLPRRAGVSSFGVGGTNAHVVLEEAPEREASGPGRPCQLLVLSARTEAALDEASENLRVALEREPSLELADVAYTLQTGRRAFGERRAVVCRDRDEALLALQRGAPAPVCTRRVELADRPLAFVFPGQGAQHAGMARGLYRDEPLFRQTVDRAAELLQPFLGADLRDLLYASNGEAEEARAALRQTSVTQPALFVVEYALAQLWLSWGLRPEAMIGHSVGEFVAAALAGVFSFEDALRLVARRGQLMQDLPAGTMLTVRLPGDELAARLPDGCSVAARNGPQLSVASGPTEAILALEKTLAEARVPCRQLQTSHAFHSAMMDPAVEPFTALVREVRLSPPRVPFVSTATGRWIRDDEATDAAYWGLHLRNTVRFADGIQTLWERPERLLLEVGPRRTMTTLALQQAAALEPTSGPRRIALASLGDGEGSEADWRALLGAVGELWCEGVSIDWDAVYLHEKRQRVALPPYPFARERFWIEPPESVQIASLAAEEAGVVAPAPANEVTMHDTDRSPVPGAVPPRRERLLERLRLLFEETSGVDLERADAQTTFFELGLDSLFLTQIALTLQREFDVKLTFRQLLEQFPTLGALAEHLDAALPAEAPAAAQSSPSTSGRPEPATAPAARASLGSSSGAGAHPLLERVIEEQLRLMAEQLELLRGGAGASGDPRLEARLEPRPTVAAAQSGAAVQLAEAEPKRTFGAMARIEKATSQAFTPRQQRCYDEFVARYTRKTAGSKAYAERHRRHLADPRVVSGFRPQLKEIIYPIVVGRSKGARLWDVDGNEYIDLLNGFGSNFFGYQPDFIASALRQQIDRGIEIGPQNPLAGEVAELICQLTGHERAAFCNTGSEAVLGALRIARTVTGRHPIVAFSGAYHGIFDEVIVRGTKKLRAVPAAPGITPQAVENVVVLDYGEASALEWLRAHGHELAAVLVEPVQSRRPELQPAAFLKELRAITRGAGAALIMDEVITGFRIHPGGAQAHFGVQGDLATYGKVIGGGMPIGVIAGKADWMDALDGGGWRFGDASVPEAGVTYFAGTFVRHPLALAAAKAVAEHLLREGPGLQARLNARADRFAREVNDYCQAVGVPLRLASFGSLCKLKPEVDLPYGELLFPWMREKGVHVWDARPVFLTTAHSDADVDRCVAALKEGVAELQRGELLPGLAASPGTAVSVPREQPAAGGARRVALTEPQREVWASAQMGPEASCAYNESITLRLRGRLDLELLCRAAQQLVKRHESLHAKVSADGAELVFDRRLVIDVPVIDLAALSPDERAEQVAVHLRREVEQPFDLERGPLVRIQVLVLAQAEHLLVFTAHHVICDGWSLNVVLRDLLALYDASRSGRDPGALPAAELYSDYAREEAEFGASPRFAEAETFWLRQFEGDVPLLDLPTDRPRPAFRSYNATREDRVLDAELVRALKKVGAKSGASFVATLLGAFQVLLYRLSGQRDLVVGLPAAGQSITGRLELVGHCVNLLPLRSQLEGGESFGAYLSRLRGTLLDALEQQRYTFGRLLQRLPIHRDPSRVPLVPVMFNIDTGIDAGLRLDGLELELGSNPRCYETFEIFLNALESAGRLTLEWTYNTDLFDPATMRAWIGAFETLLVELARDPARAIDDLPLLSPAERERMLVAWNDTRAPYPRELALHQLFERQADERAEAVAVRAADESLTYGALERRANQLARKLRELGVGPGSLVAICLERSVELVVALLGVLKAGGAYLPLDPDYPAERIAFILEDAGGPLVITQAELVASLPERARQVGQHLVLGAAGEDLTAQPEGRLPSALEPDDLAYVIYTSGSTGKPKGVQVPHGCVTNFLSSMASSPGCGADDVLLAVTTVCFDISVLELFLPLASGGRVVLADRETTADGARLAAAIEQHGVTLLQATPATWQLLVDAGWTGSKALKALCGGEALAPDLARALRARTAALWNMYGPTETTVWSTSFQVKDDAQPVPIGRPIANTQLFVLNDRLQPAPVGIPGELYIGGDGVTAGYKNRPELTGDRFVPDPFSGEAGESPARRLYRTGDLVRWRVDGALEYLGRRDFQVKVRGFRIELGEIEAVLGEHPSVGERVALVREDRPGDKRLVAYFVPRSGGGVTATELRKHLRLRLPDYMIPQHFVELDQLPRTPNGKVERKALPPPGRPLAGDGETHVAPRTDAEKFLAALWADALGLARVSVHESFFELGGHSLLSIKVLAQVAEKTGVRLSPRVMLLNTLEQIAPELEPALATQREASGGRAMAAPPPAPAAARGLLSKLRDRLRQA